MSTHMMMNEIRDPRTNFVVDIAPLEIIDKEDDEDFIMNADHVEIEINEIELIIHIINHRFIYQYWSLKSAGDDSSSSSCHHQHHRDRHHMRDDEDDEEMIMITCQPSPHPPRIDKLLVDQGGVFAASSHDDDDDYIISLLHDMDTLYEYGKLSSYEELVEMKRCITQRISEAKPAVLMAKPKRVRIHVHLSRIKKRYYANSEDANTAAVEYAAKLLSRPPPSQLLMKMKPKQASRLSKEALETRILHKEDLDLDSDSDSISSSRRCSICLIEFDVGVDVMKKMPCSHVFHNSCMLDWLKRRNTCPICQYELPTRQLPSIRWYCLPTRQLLQIRFHPRQFQRFQEKLDRC